MVQKTSIKFILVGAWTNPSQKSAREKNGFILPNFPGENNKIFELPPPQFPIGCFKKSQTTNHLGICKISRKTIWKKMGFQPTNKMGKKPTNKFTGLIFPGIMSSNQGTCIDSRGTLGSPKKSRRCLGNGFNEGFPSPKSIFCLPALKTNECPHKGD